MSFARRNQRWLLPLLAVAGLAVLALNLAPRASQPKPSQAPTERQAAHTERPVLPLDRPVTHTERQMLHIERPVPHTERPVTHTEQPGGPSGQAGATTGRPSYQTMPSDDQTSRPSSLTWRNESLTGRQLPPAEAPSVVAAGFPAAPSAALGMMGAAGFPAAPSAAPTMMGADGFPATPSATATLNTLPPAANASAPLFLAGHRPLSENHRQGPRAPSLHPGRYSMLPAAQAAALPRTQPQPQPLPPLQFIIETDTGREAWMGGRGYRPGAHLEGGYRLRRITATGIVVAGPAGEVIHSLITPKERP